MPFQTELRRNQVAGTGRTIDTQPRRCPEPRRGTAHLLRMRTAWSMADAILGVLLCLSCRKTPRRWRNSSEAAAIALRISMATPPGEGLRAAAKAIFQLCPASRHICTQHTQGTTPTFPGPTRVAPGWMICRFGRIHRVPGRRGSVWGPSKEYRTAAHCLSSPPSLSILAMRHQTHRRNPWPPHRSIWGTTASGQYRHRWAQERPPPQLPPS